MEITEAETFEIVEPSQTGEARRKMVAFAHRLGMDESAQNRINLVCTELGTNLLKHTTCGGTLIVQGITEGKAFGVEIYSLDSGKGMDVDECMVDGFSSTGTYGTGLGAVKRQSDELSINSKFGVGTVIQARIWNSKKVVRPKISVGGLNVPLHGQLISGDKWVVAEIENGYYCLLVDGLGHGIEASDASNLAVKRFKENLSLPPAAMISIMHNSLRGSRGAVGAVARIDTVNNKLDYCGLGNIAGIISSSTDRKQLVSLNGTLGYEARKILEFSQPWSSNSVLVMHSDGLSTKTFNAIPDVEKRDAPLIAGWLFKQHAKRTDDATVMVLKELKD